MAREDWIANSYSMLNGQIKIGCDLCHVPRIAKAYEDFGPRFLERILTRAEQQYVLGQPRNLTKRLAGRFAAKEAVSKVLGTGFRGIAWRDIEIINALSGKPRINLYGRAAQLAEKLKLSTWEVSISHEMDYALAFVLAFGNA